MHDQDTIAAIATPLGHGGVGIVRISGASSHAVLQRLFRPASTTFAGFRPWTLHRGAVLDASGTPLDDVLAVFMPGPRTFTGEDVAEIHCHGGPAIVAAVVEAACTLGARAAARGEFTRRAFLNGRMDLTQAEAVAEMIAAPAREGLHLARAKLDGLLGKRIGELRSRLDTLRAQVCVAVDFPEEDIECLAPEAFLAGVEHVAQGVRDLLAGYRRSRCWQEGALVVLAGQVNAGKSSLMNALLGRRRSIVTDVPGTTRDFIEEPLDLAGLPVRLVDTAGLRETGDVVEQEGVRISRDLAAQADLVLLVVDVRTGLGVAERELVRQVGVERMLLILNKTDLVPDGAPGLGSPAAALPAQSAGAMHNVSVPGMPEGCVCVGVSALLGQGIEELATAVRTAVLARTGAGEPSEGDLAPNLRQAGMLEKALAELDALHEDVAAGIPYDLCGVRLEGAASRLADITGETTPQAILDTIFESFCIGK